MNAETHRRVTILTFLNLIFNALFGAKRIKMETRQPKDRRVMLKIKLKSLADESRIIRREELRLSGGALRNELAVHRRGVVRYEARATHIAYSLIRGRTLEQIGEQPDALESSESLKAKVNAMVKKYGARVA